MASRTPSLTQHRSKLEPENLLKVIIMVSHVDTRVTVALVRTYLSNLDDATREKDYKFAGLATQLHARGEQNQDLLIGYKSCNTEFVDYIKRTDDMLNPYS